MFCHTPKFISTKRLWSFKRIGVSNFCSENPNPPYKIDTMTRHHEKNPPTDIWDDVKDPKYTDVEEVHGHWHYVEKLFPKLRIPDVAECSVSSTGWRPPPAVAPDLPYCVMRTKNHMLPVYQSRIYRERVLVTLIKKIQGDIWVFEHDLKSFLEKKLDKKIETQVNEICCHVNIGGDHIEIVKEWLYDQGF